MMCFKGINSVSLIFLQLLITVWYYTNNGLNEIEG